MPTRIFTAAVVGSSIIKTASPPKNTAAVVTIEPSFS